ncbi:MAG TPA: DUF1343 domain-containing protein [Acholeplasmataceae bacterium]|nr:DUF1343 domain-containing protein [Acholeplasmataceae bacterium]
MIKVGIEQIDKYIDVFKNKKVGLITNPTGVDRNLKSTVDILNEKVDLIALYSPEHGIRGDIQAGEKLDTYTDDITGLPVYSLYGQTRKPTKEMLENIDILCFDIQDVGARFYTYIYTMAYAMMAAKEHDIEFVVFDRPNPLGGEKTEGNILDVTYRSFVGYYPILQRHGLTNGELAKLFNEEYGIGANLTVIPVEGWSRDVEFIETDMHWVLPSPNLPTIESIYAYLATCYFEGTNVSEGRGTTKPFSFFGAPWFKNRELLEELNQFKYPGVVFREAYFTPVFSKHKDELCRGIEIIVTDHREFSPVIVGMTILKLVRKLHDEFEFRGPWSKGGQPMINLLMGDNFIKEDSLTLDEIKTKFRNDEKIFEEVRRKYKIYE